MTPSRIGFCAVMLPGVRPSMSRASSPTATIRGRADPAAALENANAGRWDLAAVHAAHPSEAMPAIDSAVAKRDPAADAALRKRTQEIVQAAQRKDPAALRRSEE